MTPPQVATALAVLSALGLAWRERRRIPAWGWRDWLVAALLAAALGTVWQVAVTAVVGTLALDWNGSRLAPTFALVYGYPLYAPPDSGPILNHVYGPVAALAFLPAAVFHTPTPAILAAGALQVTFVFGALLGFAWIVGRHLGADGRLALAAGLAACLLMTRYPGPAYWLTMVHADGPSLAFGLLACALLVARDDAPPSRAALLGSALAAALAVWSKQTAAPLPAALVLAVWLAHGRALALRYLVALLACGAALALIFFAWFGPRPMLFNMFQLVSTHPWYRPGVTGLAITTGLLLASIGELLAAGALLLALAWTTRAAAPGRWRAWLAPLLAIPLLLPTGALGANKVGGEANAFQSVYYLLALLAALLVDLGARRRAARLLAWTACALAIAAAWHAGRVLPPQPRAPLWENRQQQAYEFARRHPGEAYFPWAPLASLLAEGRLYHFEYGMIDRYLGGYEPRPEHLRAHLPPRLRWLAAHTRVWTFNHFFQDYTEAVTLPELPGWVVLTRPDPPMATEGHR